MSSNWIKLDADKLRHTEPPADPIEGTVVRFTTSPHAIPQAIRGEALPDGGLRLEFRYLDTERQHARKQINGVVIWRGKNSQRIMAIELPISIVGATDVEVQIRIDHIANQVAEVASANAWNQTFVDDNVASTASAIKQAAGRIFSTPAASAM